MAPMSPPAQSRQVLGAGALAAEAPSQLQHAPRIILGHNPYIRRSVASSKYPYKSISKSNKTFKINDLATTS